MGGVIGSVWRVASVHGQWIATLLTVAAISIGGWGVVQWQQTQPPDIGDVPLAAVTPPMTEWADFGPQTRCDKAVEGFRAYGDSELSESELWEWFDAEFGEIKEEPTASLNSQDGLTGSFAVYDDIQVWIRDSSVTAKTYDSVSHDCLPREAEPWDLRNASSQEGLCVEINLHFWGVDYGKAEPADPPTNWAVIRFDEGRRIAHGLDDLTVVYARESESDDWHRYVRGTECGID